MSRPSAASLIHRVRQLLADDTEQLAQFEDELQRFAADWYISVRLLQNPEYQRQVAEFEEALANGTLGPSATSAELREQLMEGR